MRGRTLRILIIDDHENDARLIESMLNLCGVVHYQVESALEPTVAHHRLDQGDFDCCFMAQRVIGPWELGAYAAPAADLPVIFLGDGEGGLLRGDIECIDRGAISMAVLILAIGNALRRDDSVRCGGRALSTDEFIGSLAPAPA